MQIIRKIAAFAAALGLILPLALAQAATVSQVSTATVSSDTSITGSSSLPKFVIAEQAAGDIPMGTLTWTLPVGYIFDTSSQADIAYTGTGLTGSSVVAFSGNNQISAVITGTSSDAGTLTVGQTVPLKAKAINGTPLSAAGNILLSAGSVAGIASTTSFGTLTQVPGQAAKLSFSVQPPATAAVGANFSAAVSVQDQFGNTLTTDSGRAVTVSAVLISPTSSAGTLSGATSANTSAGNANFSALAFSAPGTIQLSANSASLTSASSNNIILTATTTPTPTTTPPSISCSLKNGILVKVEGSSTVYMVVNCVLRPFTTPALFHAKGKKFQDIKEINKDQFEHLGIGKNIGEGHDDDDDIVIPPQVNASSSASSTLPNVSGLPEGAIVKLPNDATVYMVTGGQLKPFPSLAVFNLHHKKFSQITTISPQQFSQLQVGAPVTAPDGSLVQGSNQTVFVIKNGKKFGLTSLNALKRNGLSLKDVVKVPDSDLNDIDSGGNQD